MWNLVRSVVKASNAPAPASALQSDRSDLERILETFQDSLAELGVPEPPLAIRELKKRMNDGTKPKLNFASCRLSDDHIIKLVEALAVKPVIAKLDLSSNDISDASLDYIIRLLKGQVRLSRLVPVDDRLDVAFLSDVSIENSAYRLTQDKVTQIRSWADINKHCNAKTLIRRIYRVNGSPERLSKQIVEEIWRAALGSAGSADKETIAELCRQNSDSDDQLVLYEVAEIGILSQMVKRSLLPMLAAWCV